MYNHALPPDKTYFVPKKQKKKLEAKQILLFPFAIIVFSEVRQDDRELGGFLRGGGAIMPYRCCHDFSD